MVAFHKLRNPLTFSLLLHVVVLAILIVSFEFSSPMPVLENSGKNEIVNAIIVNESKIQLPEPSPFPPPKAAPELPKKIIPQRPPKASSPPPVKIKPQVKKLPTPIVHKKTIAIPDPRKKIFKQDLIEKQLLADLQKQTEKQKKERHKALEQAFAKELQAQASKPLQQESVSEKNQLSSAQIKKMQGVIDKYKALILQAISQHWLVPTGVDKSLSSELLIRVAAGGAVLDVQIVRSSGDVALDRSARSAVFKASPLPVPSNSDEFEPFRQFILKVKPQNVFARDNDLN